MVCPAIACQQVLAACAKGMCTYRKPVNIDGQSYDKSCLTANDCHLIYTGEVCSACQCGTAAVSTKGYDQYLRDRGSPQCTPGPGVCDCAPQTNVHCALMPPQVTGVCTVGP